MGRRWWGGLGLGRRPGPSVFRVMGHGPVQHIYFSKDGPRPGQAHRIFRRQAAALPPHRISFFPGPAHGVRDFSGLARDIRREVHETRALYGPARHLCGLPSGFKGPAHGPLDNPGKPFSFQNKSISRMIGKYVFFFSSLLSSGGWGKIRFFVWV